MLKKKRINRKLFATLLLVSVILAVTLLAFTYISKEVTANCWQTLAENVSVIDDQFAALVQSNQQALDSLAADLAETKDFRSAQTIMRIQGARVGTMHSPVRLFLPDGFAITERGIEKDISSRIRYDEIRLDVSYVSPARFDIYREEVPVIEHYCPVMRDGDIAAMLCAVVKLQTLPNYIHTSVYGGKADILVFDRRDHLFFFDTSSDAYLSAGNTPVPLPGFSYDEWWKKMSAGEPCSFAFTASSGKEAYIYSIPSQLGDNWMISLQVDGATIFASLNSIGSIFMLVLLIELSCMLLYGLYIRADMTKRHKADNERNKKSISDLNVVLTAMTEGFESLILVDYDTGEEICYRAGERMKDIASLSDYESRVREFAEQFVIKEDRAEYLAGMTRKNVMTELDRNGICVLRYHIRDKAGQQTPLWYETRIVRNPEKKDGHSAVVGFRNVDAEVQLENERQKARYDREMMRVINSLTEDYACVLLVDPDKDTSQTFRISETYLSMIPDWYDLRSFFDQLDRVIENTVHPDDRASLRAATEPAVLTRQLAVNHSYVCPYRQLANGDTQRWALKFTVADRHPIRIIAGFYCVEAEYQAAERQQLIQIEHSQQKAFISLFVDSYVSIYYVNLKDGAFVTYKRNQRLKDKYGDMSEYIASIDKYIAEDAYPEDRTMLTKETRIETIRERLLYENEYSVVFREAVNGIRYIRMSVIRGHDEAHAAIGFRDITREYMRQAEEKEHLEQLVRNRTAELQQSNEALRRMNENITDMLGTVIEGRDPDSGNHVQRVKGFTRILVRQVMRDMPEYGIDEHMAELITSASSLHDVGKILISDSILLKPGKLTKEEFEIMKTHSERGCEILEQTAINWTEEYLNICKDICRHHHEKWDGRGYPDGLAGDDIPIAAQIVSLADIFDALTTKRCYKPAFTCEEAFGKIERGECGAFSDKLMATFQKCKPQFINYAASERGKTQKTM